MIVLCHSHIWYSSVHMYPWDLSGEKALLEWAAKMCGIINNSAVHCPISLKFDSVVRYGFRVPQNCKKTIFDQMKDVWRRQDWTYFNRNDSAADCSISFKFGSVWSLHSRYTTNVQDQVVKMMSRSQRDVTYQQKKRCKSGTNRVGVRSKRPRTETAADQ